MESITLRGNVEIKAASKGPPRVEIRAYGGDVMPIAGFGDVAIDLAGLKLPASIPLLADHDSSLRGVIGAGRPRVENGMLMVSGTLAPSSDAAKQIIELAKTVEFQASVGVASLARSSTKSATVNGRTISRPVPFSLVSKSSLREVSIVALGADPSTAVEIAAAKRAAMPNTITDEPNETAGAADEQIAAAHAFAHDAERIAGVRKIVTAYRSENPADGANDRLDAIEAKALSEQWDLNRVGLEALRASRPNVALGRPCGTRASRGGGEWPSDRSILEASICLTGGLSEDFLAKQCRYGDRVIDAASGSQNPFRGATIHTIFSAVIEAAGRRSASGMSRSALFREAVEANNFIRAAGFSSFSVPGILSNVANKYLLDTFMAEENAWRFVASRRPVNDFKEVTSYRLTGDMEFEELAPGGEIEHATVDEESFTNQAKSYARMFALPMQAMVNDDLSAFIAIPRKIGRGASLKLNSVFWTEFLADHSTFFPTDGSKDNYISGATAGVATDSRMNIDGLSHAISEFRRKTDADGKPLALRPTVLLVPPELEGLALALNMAVTVNTGGSSTEARVANGNPYVGQYPPVVSSYLTSSAEWYMFANPAQLSAIEVAFLNGQETPTIESSDTDFNTLGAQFRGHFHFGVNKQDYRAALKSKGAA